MGALLNTMRIAHDYGLDFRFVWAAHPEVSPELRHPEHLFSADFLTRHRETQLTFGELQRNMTAVEQLPFQATTQDQFREVIATGEDLRCGEAMRAVSLPWENQSDVSARLAGMLDRIEFSPTVRAGMEQIRTRLSNTRLVAYHLRRGDIIDPDARPSNTLWPNKYLPRVFYEEHMLRVLNEDPGNRLVLFSDSPREIAFFVQRAEHLKVADRLVVADHLLQDMDLELLQRDFLELFTMSCCREILGPGASAFSSVAALLGNSRIKDVKVDLTPQERHAAAMTLTDRLDNQPEMFAGDADLGQNFPELLEFHTLLGTPERAVGIIQKHFDRGFSYSYIYDLMARQYFLAGNADGARMIVEALKERPILTDLANAQSYAWAGLAALAAGRCEDATRLAQVASWLNPILAPARSLLSALAANGLAGHNQLYPLPAPLMSQKPAVIAKFQEIHARISPAIAQLTGAPEAAETLSAIPFELELRDWEKIQTTRYPSAFWNIPKQQKMIDFFKATYRKRMDDPAITSMLGQMTCQAGAEAEGAALIEAAAAQAPDDPFSRIRLARLQMRRGAISEALSNYDAASDLSDNQICFLAEYGLARFCTGDKAAGSRIFETIAGTEHSLIEVLILTADVLRRRGNTRELALSLAQKADQLAPGALRTTQILRKILEQVGRKSDAAAIENKMRGWKRRPGRFSSRIQMLDAGST